MQALVVDDSRATRMILKRMLASLGFDAVAEAEHGLDALGQLAGGCRPDVVLCDWNMPEMDGIAFVRHLRGQPEYERLPVLMVTSESSPRQVYEALRAGADDFAIKPITAALVAQKLASLGIFADERVAG